MMEIVIITIIKMNLTNTKCRTENWKNKYKLENDQKILEINTLEVDPNTGKKVTKTLRTKMLAQAEEDFQDYMLISESEFEIIDNYLVLKYKLDS